MSRLSCPSKQTFLGGSLCAAPPRRGKVGPRPGRPKPARGRAPSKCLRRADNRAQPTRCATINPATACLGMRFAYTALRQSPHRRKSRPVALRSILDRKSWLTRNLPWLPNSSFEDLGRAKTDAPLGVDPRWIVSK